MSVLTNLVIPSSCVSFSEMADYLVEYTIGLTQDTLVNMSDIVVESYLCESDEESQEGKSKEYVYFNEITNSISKAREASNKFYEKAKEKFTKEVETNKSTYKLNKRMVSTVKPNQVFRSIHSFDLLDKIKPVENCIKFLNEVVKVFEKLKDNKKALQKASAMLNEELYKEISGLESSNIEDINDSYKDYLIGKKIKIDKNWLEMNYDEVKSVVISGDILRVLNEMQTAEDKIYSSALNAIDNLDKELGNALHVDHFSLIMNCLNVLHKCNAIILDVYHRKTIEYKGVVTGLNIRSTNEASNEEEQGTADEQNDGKFDMKPQELAKTASQNPVTEPSTDTSSTPMPVQEGNISKHMINMAKKGSISAAGAAGGIIGSYVAKKALDKVDNMLEKRRKEKEEKAKEDNKSEEKH